MEIDTAHLDKKALYGLMTQTIIPRPVAWVLTENADHSHNLAPISYFNGVTSAPPIISLSVGLRPDGTPKDTRHNITEREYFVVHIARPEQAEAIEKTGESLPPGDSEITHAGLTLTHDKGWTLPRLTEAPVAMLCTRHQIIEVGDTPQAIILGHIRKIHLSEEILSPQTASKVPQIDPTLLAPICRLGGKTFATLHQITKQPSS